MLTPNVVARALDGVPPTIDLVLGYNDANTNPLLLRLLSRADELVANVQEQSIIRYVVQSMGARLTHIVDVPFCFVGLHEAMSLVEAV